MTSKIEVSRELLEELLDGADSMGWSIAEVIRDMLATQEAPHQEPVAAFEVSHGPMGDDGAQIWVRLKDLQDFDIENLADGTKLYLSAPAPLSPDHSGGGAGMVLPEREPLPITDGMDRLMEAYRLGEFRLEGGSPTVEAMSCKSFDEHEIALQAYDLESYSAGYQAAMYEEVSSLLGHIACLDKVKELNQ